MSHINKLNHEAYALDYLEGQLPPDLQAEMEAFLGQNPDIRAEWEGLGLYYLPPAGLVPFSGKEALLREVPPRKRPLFLYWMLAAGGLLVLALAAWALLLQAPAKEAPMMAQPHNSPAALPTPRVGQADMAQTKPSKEEPRGLKEALASVPKKPKTQTQNPKKTSEEEIFLPSQSEALVAQLAWKPSTEAVAEPKEDGQILPPDGKAGMPRGNDEASKRPQPLDIPTINPPKILIQAVYAYGITIQPQPVVAHPAEDGLLEKWGLLPEDNKSWSFNHLKDAFTPEALAKR